ncbi:MAG: hypothetical protein Q8936_21180 [Bacillota bacterium]|nr:hypothetical protein [Bacillota bacterium]
MSLIKKSKYICPFCFTEHKLNEVEFRCSSDPKKCAYEKDDKFTDMFGVEQLKGRVIKNMSEDEKNVMPKEAFCPKCGGKTTVRLCPTCHSELPYTVGEYEDLIFAVIGAKEAGKSHYISVLIDKIMNEIGTAFNCSLQPINDETIKRYRNDFYYPVFRKNEVIRVTRSARTDSSVRKPLIYTLTFKEDGILGGLLKSKKINNVVTVAFFDTAGEDLNEEDVMQTVNKYIYNSSGIIFLLDPLQLPEVREGLPVGTPLPEQNTEMEDLLARTANLIRKAKGINMNKLIEIPVAVAFSKMDAVAALMDPSSCINYPSKHVKQGKFDLGDFEDVNGFMESLVRSWGGENFANQLSANFKEHAYFGITALGCNPESNKIGKLRPHRVEDPFLWLLWKRKLIKSEKRK